MKGFSVTFERFFPHDEGDDVCEADESGFVVQNVSFRDALQDGLEYLEPSWAVACYADCYPAHGVRWLTFAEWNQCTREQIEQGISESRTLHFPRNLTEASRRRLCRMFGVKV
jgi:hypothetical protein